MTLVYLRHDHWCLAMTCGMNVFMNGVGFVLSLHEGPSNSAPVNRAPYTKGVMHSLLALWSDSLLPSLSLLIRMPCVSSAGVFVVNSFRVVRTKAVE